MKLHLIATATAIVCLVSISATQAALVSYYAFEGNALDSAGGRNGTLVGSATFSANVPASLTGDSTIISTQSLSLPAVGSRMVYDVLGIDALSGSYTVAMWVNAPSSTGTFFGTRSPSDQSFDAKLSGATIHGDIGSGGAWIDTSADGPFAFSADTWIHVAYVVGPTGYTLYVNGALSNAEAFAGIPLLFDANHDIAIGAVGVGGGEDFVGLIDDVRIYDNQLTQPEIQALVTPPAVPEPSTIALVGLGCASCAWAHRRRRYPTAGRTRRD